jgi:hemoglobin
MSGAEPTLYERVGGDAGVRALVDRFYDHMDTDPAAAAVRSMHPRDLSGSRDKLYDFLCGWLGGPQRYVEKHGHPRLRARHLPFPINTDGAAQWMLCMRAALAGVEDAEVRTVIEGALGRLADHMRNVD